MDAVALTSRLTAAMRAVETRRPDRLYEDPFAEALAGEEGFAFLRELAAQRPKGEGPSIADFNAIRTRFFDQCLGDFTARQAIHQVVLVGSGMDTRGYRLSWPRGTHLFELERGEVLAARAQVLGALKAERRCALSTVAVDVRSDFARELAAAGFERELGSVWVLEGLLYYFAEREARALLERIRALGTDARVLADLVNEATLVSPLTRPYLECLKAKGAPYVFATDEPAGWFARCGFEATVKEPWDEDVSCGRMQRLDLGGPASSVPRAYLVVAAA